MPELYPDLTGKKILVLSKHATIGHAMKLNLEYILHLTVEECTLNRENSHNLPSPLLEYEPDLVLIAEPADQCDIHAMFRKITWLQRYKSIPYLILCAQPELLPIDSDYIYTLQFPYEQEELHTTLSSILYKNDTELPHQDEFAVPQTSILIVEDEWIVASDLRKILENYNYKVCGVTGNIEDAVETVEQTHPDIIMIDKDLASDLVGNGSPARPFQTYLDIPVIIISSFGDQKFLETIESNNSISHILRPFDEREVVSAVKIALYKQQVEFDLRQRSEELVERNAELDAFTWAIAHEIRDPINITRDFAEMLVGEKSLFTEGDMRHSLNIIRDLTVNVQETVDNLTLLATLRDTPVAFETVNMSEVVARAERRLEALKHKYNADIIQLGPWPEVIGHSPWIEEIWVKFISRAIRYGGTPPKLLLGSTHQLDEVRFWVRDNGPRILDEEKRLILSPYPSTHLKHRFNTSLGLTVVTRIASRLGSRLSIESTPDQGNTFAFTLPSGRHRYASVKN